MNKPQWTTANQLTHTIDIDSIVVTIYQQDGRFQFTWSESVDLHAAWEGDVVKAATIRLLLSKIRSKMRLLEQLEAELLDNQH